MKILLAPVLTCLAVAVALAAPARADIEAIKARGSMRVLVAADETPQMFSFEHGQAPGFEREILEAFCRLHRMRLEVVKIVRFEEILPALIKGQGDLVTGILDTEARRKRVDFTVEILPSRLLLVTQAPRVLRSLAELPSERVGVVTGTAWAEAATAAGIAATRIESLKDMESLLEALRAAKIAAAVMSFSDFALERRRAPQLRAGPFLGGARTAAWAVRKDDPRLKAALDDFVQNLRRSPSWSRMAVTYFGDDALQLLGRAKTE